MRSITVCFSPALYPYCADNDTVVVIVDVFRASTSMCAAFKNGIHSIKTVASIDEAIAYKNDGYLVAAERNTQKCDFADFGNSPFDFTSEKVAGKELIFTTTNGTQAVDKAMDADNVIIGTFSNITAVENFCLKSEKNILILCAGWNNRFCIEDTLFAGALADKLLLSGLYGAKGDSTNVAIQLWNFAKSDLFQYICTSEHYERLRKNGLESSVEYCLTFDTVSLVPELDKESKSFFVNR